eukprot:741366-Rhodomonas_salina.3
MHPPCLLDRLSLAAPTLATLATQPTHLSPCRPKAGGHVPLRRWNRASDPAGRTRLTASVGTRKPARTSKVRMELGSRRKKKNIVLVTLRDVGDPRASVGMQLT